MIKFVQCVTRKPGMEAIEFRQRWQAYGDHLEALARKRKNVVRFQMSTMLLVKETVDFMINYGSAAPFDGMVEIWLEDATITAANLRGDPETQAQIRELVSFLEDFTDREKSTAFFAAEEVAFERAA